MKFLGYTMGQNGEALNAFSAMFNALEKAGTKPIRVIEIGTFKGGLSFFLHAYCRTVGASFVTYDIKDLREHPAIMDSLGIDFRLADIFGREQEVADLIRKPGLTVLVCDGGNKPREFNLFSQYLKSGDIILAHDYSPTPEFFLYWAKAETWSWAHEIVDAHIKESCEKHRLSPFMQHEFLKAAWCCRRKA